MTTKYRKCSICGKLLCKSNPEDHCWHHDIDEEDETLYDYCLCSSRVTYGFNKVQLNYHGNYGLGVNHNFER